MNELLEILCMIIYTGQIDTHKHGLVTSDRHNHACSHMIMHVLTVELKSDANF